MVRIMTNNRKKTDKANQQKWTKEYQDKMKAKNVKATKGSKRNR